MRRLILLFSIFIVLASCFNIYVAAEDGISVEAAYDDSFGGENDGKFAVTVTNNSKDSTLCDIAVSLGLPEGVSVASDKIVADILASGESYTHDFVLSFEKSASPAVPVYWIVIGAVVLLALFVAAFIILRKSKKGAASVTSLLAFALLFGSVGVLADEAQPVFEKTFEIVHERDTHQISVTVSHSVALRAESYPLKGDTPTSPNEDYNTPQINKNRIKENAGPLTNSKIYVGRNDFMFLGETVPDYTGTNLYHEARLDKMAEMMNERNAWAEENGIDLYFVICPNKATVYSDYVPDKLKQTDYSRFDQVVDRLNEKSDVQVIDLRDALISAREEYGDTLYYKYDTHWTQHAGFVAYTEIMKHVAADNPEVVTYGKNSFNVKNYETYMKDIAYYLGYYDDYYDEGPVYSLKAGPAATLLKKNNDGNWGQFRFCFQWPDGYRDNLKYFEYESKNESAPSLYLLRDSYSIALVPFLKESFSTSVFDWSRNFSKKKILDSGADVVIIQVAEKFMDEISSSRTFTN